MRKICWSLAVIGVVVVPFVHVLGFAQNYPSSVTQKVLSAQRDVRTIGMPEYRKIVDNPANALIIDVREPDEYAAGHVPGAINIPRGMLEFQIWKQVGFPAKSELDKPLYLQCSSGNRAALAAKSLRELGFTDVTAVVMSLDEWQKAANPFVK
ncbi:MAG: sulfurtransferase [Nitrospira sp.]